MDVADKPAVRLQCDLLIALRHRLDRLMIRRHAEADQAVRDRQAVDQVYPAAVAVGLEQRLGRIEARWPGPDHGEVAHGNCLPVRAAVYPAAGRGPATSSGPPAAGRIPWP